MAKGERMKEYICKEVQTENGGYLEIETELIRCRDCKSYRKKYRSDEYYCNSHCEGIDGEPLIPTPNDYCSWAEPKDCTAEVRRQLKETEQRKEMERKK